MQRNICEILFVAGCEDYFHNCRSFMDSCHDSIVNPANETLLMRVSSVCKKTCGVCETGA